MMFPATGYLSVVSGWSATVHAALGSIGPWPLLLCAGAALIGLPRPARRMSYASRDGPHRGRPAAKPGTGAMAVAREAELFATCLGIGLNAATAAGCVADTAEGVHRRAWLTTSRLLALGLGAQEAFAPLGTVPGLRDIAGAAVSAERSGQGLADAAARVAAAAAEQAEHQAIADAERAGVLVALPITLCFLPAFILLGLVPIVVSFRW